MRSSKPIHRTRLARILFISAIVITLTSIGLHLWFKYNARRVLKNYISEQSHGKIKLELSELDLNLFLNRLQIREADLVSTDSTHETITYHVTFRKLTLRVASVWDLLFKNKLELDSIKLHDPIFEVMQWRKDTARQKDELSIPQEMGKVYHSMQDALNEFGIRRIVINNAQIRLINKIKPAAQPVTVSAIYFDLSRPDPKNKTVEEIDKEQAIELRTTNQNIALPGGRYRLAFRSFKLQLLRQRIEFDSCTIMALATDSSASNYRIFFTKLFLSGVDLNAMSTQNVIRADSVYCENPYFDFDLYRSVTAKKKAGLPDVQKMISELSGNLDLAFVGITNAGIHFNVHGKSTKSFYNSNKDNFEMRNFRIAPDSSEPVSIKRFEMTLRDYHLYNGDSSSAFAFDSLHLLNNKIALNNFSVTSSSGRNKIRNDIDIKVPYFQLTDLDWYQMIFDQKLAATEAALISPVIYFKHNVKPVRRKKINLFTALENIDSLVELNKVSVTNGRLNMQLKAGTSFDVQDLDLALQSNKLLSSTNKAALRRSMEHLSFSKGILHLKNITAQMQEARYSGNNQVYTDKISVTSKDNSVSGSANNVHINNLLIDNAGENISMDGMDWESAVLSIKALPSSGEKNNSNIDFKNISVNKTQLSFFNGPVSVTTFISTLHAAAVIKNKKEPLRLEGFSVSGNDLLVKNKSLLFSGDAYNIIDNQPSYLRGLQLQQVKQQDSISVHSPQIKISADLNALLANDIHLTDLQASAPVITVNKWNVAADTNAKKQSIRIDKFAATEPEIFIATHRNDSVAIINIPRSQNSLVNALGINIMPGEISLQTLKANTTAAMFTKTNGERTGIEKGIIDFDISNIYFSKKDGKPKWNAMVNLFSVQDTGDLQIGKKNKLKFKQASFGNMNLSSDYLPGISKLLKASVSAWMRIPQGSYTDSNNIFKWYNAAYDNTSRTLRIDSLQYHPLLSLDSSLAHAKYQSDYTTIQTGAVTISGLNAEQYEKDSSFIADAITISNPLITFYRDKLPPNSPFKKAKPLPVDMIKNITLPVAVSSVQIQNGTITYGEKNAKSRKEGFLHLTRLEGGFGNIKNHNISNSDSLSITLKGYLMDSAHLDIAVKESYTDPLSGFNLNVRISPTPLSILNPVIVPISNVKVASGILDSLTMHAVGRNDMALGEMKMYYHDLRIKLIKEGIADRSTFLQNIASFFANTFLIKNKNTSRTGVVYYERVAIQSFPKYILKMTLSGAASSVGAKSNRKYKKQYEKKLKSSGVPPLNLPL